MVIRQMARDLAIPTEVIACPTVREPDGLALSSRNVHLSPAERAAAPVLRRALLAARERWEAGERSGDALRDAMRERPGGGAARDAGLRQRRRRPDAGRARSGRRRRAGAAVARGPVRVDPPHRQRAPRPGRAARPGVAAFRVSIARRRRRGAVGSGHGRFEDPGALAIAALLRVVGSRPRRRVLRGGQVSTILSTVGASVGRQRRHGGRRRAATRSRGDRRVGQGRRHRSPTPARRPDPAHRPDGRARAPGRDLDAATSATGRLVAAPVATSAARTRRRRRRRASAPVTLPDPARRGTPPRRGSAPGVTSERVSRSRPRRSPARSSTSPPGSPNLRATEAALQAIMARPRRSATSSMSSRS